jgi:hypothetical protein
VCVCVCVCVCVFVLPSEFTTETFLPGRVQTIQFSYRAVQWPEIRGIVKKFPHLFDIHSLVDREFVPPGQSVTGHLYVQGFAKVA